MKRVWSIALLTASLALASLLPALAQQRNGIASFIRNGIIARRFIAELNLSQAQRAKMKAILQKEQPEIERLVVDSRRCNEQLRMRTDFDEAYVRVVAAKQATNLTEAIVERERIRAEIMAVLTPQQREIFDRNCGQLREAIEERLMNPGALL